MNITIQLQKEAASALQGEGPETEASREINEAAREMGIRLRPLHPGTKDPNLASYFYAEVPDAATAERVLSRLGNCGAINAAYLKPPDELP